MLVRRKKPQLSLESREYLQYLFRDDIKKTAALIGRDLSGWFTHDRISTMSIAIIEPVGGHGGMNYYDFGLAPGLSAAGAAVTVYTCDKTDVPTDLPFTVKITFNKTWGDDHKLLRAARFSCCLLHSMFDAKRNQIKQVKRLDLLLEALPAVLEEFPALKLVIAGKVCKNDFLKFSALIRKNNLQEHVVLHSRYIPDDEVTIFYRASDLVVLPYRKIYQSGVLLMAMSYGVPAVVSGLKDMKEIVQGDKNGFIFQTDNKDDLGTSLIRALSDKEKLQQVSRAAVEEINHKYDWHTIGQQTVSLYQSIQ